MNKTSRRSFIILVLGLSLLGCATTSQQTRTISSEEASPRQLDSTSPSKATVYVLREWAFFGAAIGFEIKDNGRIIGNIGPGGFLMWERDPGFLIIGVSALNKTNISLKTEAGNTYFLETSPDWQGFFTQGQVDIELLSKSDGIALLKQLKEK